MKRLGLIALLVCSACEEEELRRVNPAIYVCARADAPSSDCNVPIDLGDVAITLPRSISLFVTNRGEGALAVSSITSPDSGSKATPAMFGVIPGGNQMVTVEVTARDLGPGTTNLVFTNDDPERLSLVIELRFVGVPKPVPRIELC